ncbi:glycosyltransferase [Edaphobacter aggregans]|uniref:glycosyltransferase n=1 Tax=Edaphobacter aggregans TaxID=570835 RepID=UPI000A629880|nr:glycosyltransferase [Edaphobacter aggregans]
MYAVVPTLNAAADWARFAPILSDCISPRLVLILDSSSHDGTPELARTAGFAIRNIPRAEFNHGGTRQFGIELLSDADVVVFLTQDAILADATAINMLIRAFDDPTVGAAYGRQLPRPGAEPIEAHARLFNYGQQSVVRSIADRERLGFKSIFISNSFAAYRRTALLAVGGFPKHVIFGEDTVVAGKLLLSGWKIAYTAEAEVYHSHSYTMTQEFRRYFDIGVLHAREGWLRREFGSAGGEGMRFVRSELSYLWGHCKWLIPDALSRTCLKWIGYRLGRIENKLNIRWKRMFSLHASFWHEDQR